MNSEQMKDYFMEEVMYAFETDPELSHISSQKMFRVAKKLYEDYFIEFAISDNLEQTFRLYEDVVDRLDAHLLFEEEITNIRVAHQLLRNRGVTKKRVVDALKSSIIESVLNILIEKGIQKLKSTIQEPHHQNLVEFPLPLAQLEEGLDSVTPKKIEQIHDVMLLEEVDLKDFLKENPNNIVFGLYHDGMLTNLMSYPKSQFYKDTLGATKYFYECTKQNTGLSVPFDIVVKDHPYINVTGFGNYFVPASRIKAFLDSNEQVFAVNLDHELKRLNHMTIVDTIQINRGLNYKQERIDAFSSDHCQAGTHKIVYDIVIVTLPSKRRKK